MNRMLLLVILLKTFHLVIPSEWPLKNRSIILGDLFLGGFFPVHGRDNEKICGKLHDEGFLELEAMLYTVKTINNDATFLPGITLGVIAVDSCDSIPRALEGAVDFAKGIVIRENAREKSDTFSFKCGDNSLPHFEPEEFEKVVAIVGGHSSWVSRQVADLMRIYKMPQVSYQSTSPIFSDPGYEYFFRTVPPLNHQIKAILEVLKYFKWKYFALVYADSAYGNRGAEVLRKEMPRQNETLCISNQQRINVENSRDKDYDDVIEELLKRKANAVVVFGDHEMVRNLMSAATRARIYKRFVWIGSTAWVGREYVIKGNEDVLEGTIAITHDMKPFKGFYDYIKSKDLKSHAKTNPWFPEYWEQHLNCRVTNFHETPFNGNYTNACLENATLPSSCYRHVTPSLQFVRDAVYSIAQALRDIYDTECETGNLENRRQCLKEHSMIGQTMKSYLSKVKFQDENNNLFKFDVRGDAPPRYTITNLKKNDKNSDLHWINVGTYYDGGLEMKANLSSYKHDDPLFPESFCSASCKEGEAKILLDEASCCWHCTKCLDDQYVENGTMCKDCPLGALPNFKRDGCEPIAPMFMDFTDLWAIGCIVFSLIGIFTTLCVAGVIGKYWNTPIVMSSGREFNFILLTGIILSFSLTFGIVSKPSDISCGIVRFSIGSFYTISYAAIAAKTRYLSRLNARKEANKKPKPMNTKFLVLITLALIAVESTISITWLLHSPPMIDYQYPTRTEEVIICKGSDTEGYLVGLVFPFFLMLFCTIYALRIRNFTGAFNESRYINFTNYTTFIVWLAFLPMFLFNNVNLLRVVVLSLLLNVSALVQLVCLFLPKVYIALRRPEKNKHENVMCYEVQEPCETPATEKS